MKAIHTAAALALALTSGAAMAALYSNVAVQNAEGLYKSHYYGAEQALNCAGFTNVSPTRPGMTVVPGKDYVVVPHPAVKWAAEVDMQPRAHGVPATLCTYIQKPDVKQWYKQNFHI